MHYPCYRRSGNFRVRNVRAGNFCCVALFRVRNVRAFNFRRLSNWRKIFDGENFPIYGMCLRFTFASNFYFYNTRKGFSFLQACMVEDNTTAILFPGEHGFSDEQATRQQVCNSAMINSDFTWKDMTLLPHVTICSCPLLPIHQTEYQVEEHMYRVFMDRGEDSPDYQELVQLREDAASKYWSRVYIVWCLLPLCWKLGSFLFAEQEES